MNTTKNSFTIADLKAAKPSRKHVNNARKAPLRPEDNEAPYNIGMDLHSDNVVVVIRRTVQGNVHLKGETIFSKIFRINTPTGRLELFQALEFYCSIATTRAVVESTYNWYWLADEFERRGWDLRIADPSTVSNAKRKYSDDWSDAEFLAEMVRINSIKSYEYLPKHKRAIRDLCRMRQEFINLRAQPKITIANFYVNQLGDRIKTNKLVKAAYEALENDLQIDSDAVISHFDDPLIRTRVAMYLKMIIFYDEQIEILDQKIQEVMKPNTMAMALQTIKGCGPVLSSVIASELGDNLARFKSVKNFVSYCRLAPTAKLSNGKSKGESNAKNGNAYLSWGFTELANMVVKFNPEAKAFYDRHFRRTKLRVKAVRIVAAKLARAVFKMLQTGEVFDIKRCFEGN